MAGFAEMKKGLLSNGLPMTELGVEVCWGLEETRGIVEILKQEWGECGVKSICLLCHDAAEAHTIRDLLAETEQDSPLAEVGNLHHPDGFPVKIYMVDTVPALWRVCQQVVSYLATLPVTLRMLAVDLEGINLGRNGTISLLQFYACGDESLYLVDILKLGAAAFKHPGSPSRVTLRSLLESDSIRKLLFDPRADAEALYYLYHVNLRGVICCQLLHTATTLLQPDRYKTAHARHVASLATVIQRFLPTYVTDSPLLSLYTSIKEKGKAILQNDPPEACGRAFDTRPLPASLIRYSSLDVLLLQPLYSATANQLSLEWLQLVAYESANRIALSKTGIMQSSAVCPPSFLRYSAALHQQQQHPSFEPRSYF